MPATARTKSQDGATAEIEQYQNEEPQIAVAPFLNEKHRTLLRKGMCSTLTEDQADYFFEVVERTALDPFQGQIWPSLRQSKDSEGVRHPTLFVLIKLQGFRAIGDRSRLSDGEDPVEWTGEDGVWKPEWLLKEPPIAARARVYRKDRSRPQVVVCRWDAYCQFVFDRSGKEIPNAIWKRLGSHMLGKCALAGAYRGAFPRQASGVYLTEELGDRDNDESEAAIEAEMTRRYAREKEYWDAEKEKGHYPVGQEPAQPIADPQPPPPAMPPLNITTTPVTVSAPAPEIGDWRTFLITRIKIFQGQTVGALSQNDIEGLTPWLERVSNRWGTLDNDLKNHYTAICQRKAYDKEHASETLVDDELQFGLEPSNRR